MKKYQIDWVQGSSPLTRGKPPEDPEPVRDPGLIPAHAGKTSSTSPTSWQGWAHPRSRGENHYEYANPENIKGSSPLTRGKPDVGAAEGSGAGLIPAHAGKTAQALLNLSRVWAHPRSRGENTTFSKST